MIWRCATWICCVLMMLAAGATNATESGGQLLHLDGNVDSVMVSEPWVWLDAGGQARISDVASGRHRFAPTNANDRFPLRPGVALWEKLQVQRASGTAPGWVIELPTPTLDRVTLHVVTQEGEWRSFSAGDLVELSDWPIPGRYPSFRLPSIPVDRPLDVYLEIRHGTAMLLPLRLATSADHEERAKLEYLGLGLALGGLVLVVIGGLWQSWAMRDATHGWFAAYGLLAMATVAAYTGVAGHLFWGDSVVWNDAAPGCLALLAGSACLTVVAHVTSRMSRGRVLSKSIRVTSLLGPMFAALYIFVLSRAVGIYLLATFLVLTLALVVAAGVSSWRRGEAVGRWLVAGLLPIGVAILLALARVFGLVGLSWLTEYIVVAAVAWNLCTLRAALNNRSRERRSAILREQALASHDPLTGLSNSAFFRGRVAKALSRFQQTREPAALVVVEVANLPALKAARGAEAAEESLLRGVIKVQKLVRDADAIGRVGDASLGILFEGVGSRATVNEFASHLVASGLMEDPEHPRDPALHFHVAAVLFNEHPSPGVALLDALLHLLTTMSPRTRRPVRYLQALPSEHDRALDFVASAELAASLQVDRMPDLI